jgi:hypothetical protein
MGDAAGRTETAPDRLQAEGVTALLDVMDTLAAIHPGFAEQEEALEALTESEREAAFDGARSRNEASVELKAAIGRLVATPTYQVYFRRFTNITAKQVGELLLNLPYRRSVAPGDVGVTLYDLLRRREIVRMALDRLVRQADMRWVYQTARNFAPGWTGEAPIIHLFYDSNAGSFAAEGLPFFNIFTGVDLDALVAGNGLGEALRKAEQTMAHELQHVLAEATLYPKEAGKPGWQERWLSDLTRGLVGEGVANLCSPPSGEHKATYEDPEVLKELIVDYGDVIRRLLAGTMTEEQVSTWYRENYFDRAIDLLRAHLTRDYAGEELEEKLQSSMRFRPDVEHALGWWMVSRVWEGDPRREVVAGLLEDPFSIYRRYNETTGSQEALTFPPDLVDELERFSIR